MRLPILTALLGAALFAQTAPAPSEQKPPVPPPARPKRFNFPTFQPAVPSFFRQPQPKQPVAGKALPGAALFAQTAPAPSERNPPVPAPARQKMFKLPTFQPTVPSFFRQ